MRIALCAKSILVLAAAWIAGTESAHAVGSGGILNVVPQAVVTETNGKSAEAKVLKCKVYVHPMEGSIVLIVEGSNDALALDKNKKHAILMKVTNIKISEDRSTIDVPEKIPYQVLREIPHFNRTFASLIRNDGSRLVIRVER